MMRSRRVKSLILGMPPWDIPTYLKKTQASKLGDTQGIPFFINKVSGSAFSCEYSYSSLISVEYSCLATAMLSALVFHASLVRAVSYFMIDFTLLFHC